MLHKQKDVVRSSTPKVGFVSLGCPKALVDTEVALTQLVAQGYQTVPRYEDADLVVVNTCGFIDDAVKESLDAISQAIDHNGKVVVTGCLGAKTTENGTNLVQQLHPKVLAVTGPHDTAALLGAIHQHLPKPHDPLTDLVPPQGIKLTPKHYAYLKISEGCNHRCSFCIIPSMRGDLMSRPIGDVMREAEKLVNAGVKEILVISQDTSAYGVDLKYRTDFVNGVPVKSKLLELCKELGKLGVWVRLHYVYPYPHVNEIIPLMQEGLILPYLDVPLQHANARILKLMKRPADAQNNLERIRAWRAICPDITLRSTFITGFPGETEAEFQELLDFLNEAQLDRVGAFAYSPVEGATANQLPNPVPDEVREERRARLMELQEDISFNKQQQKIGKTFQVLIDSITSEGAIGRTAADAPEIDGLVMIPSPPLPKKRGADKERSQAEHDQFSKVRPGMWVNAQVTQAGVHDLKMKLKIT
jgi:ribosomal protein S12 methylthiotransferase